jgi:hypothetical protein
MWNRFDIAKTERQKCTNPSPTCLYTKWYRSPSLSSPKESTAFRRRVKLIFRLYVVGLFVVAAALIAIGWWCYEPWGVAGGTALALLLLLLGLPAGGIIYALI